MSFTTVRQTLSKMAQDSFYVRGKEVHEGNAEEQEAVPSSERADASVVLPRRLLQGGYHSGGGNAGDDPPPATAEPRSSVKVKSEGGENLKRGMNSKRGKIVTKPLTREVSKRERGPTIGAAPLFALSRLFLTPTQTNSPRRHRCQ